MGVHLNASTNLIFFGVILPSPPLRNIHNHPEPNSTCARIKTVATLPCNSSRRTFLQALLTAYLASQSHPTHASPDLAIDYDRFATTYDILDGPNSLLSNILGLEQARRELISRAFGIVLEVGVGTGVNLAYYDPGKVDKVIALDSSEGMMMEARRKIENEEIDIGVHVDFVKGDVGVLEFDSGYFDSVVDTFSLCVFDRPDVALREMRRVVRKDKGRVLLLEHVKSENGILGWYQDVTAGPVAKLGKGCFWNQDVLGMAKDAGLSIVDVERLVAGAVLKGEFQGASLRASEDD
eukprot:Plantae.Rhodophyta-Hildenbrandia_rubra.ctg3448.p3 GENE.Plantae.Rhodophyta-Hildenbrandia_rubra.ctg3448~~Plantae.Rhodophyta-Hildenbrandia_rubra.ctg3448.p3  ORF type:complete len:294 (+),score=63.66 Plantae.Rhodophyta-Hildenbrandia_rubra.ctg3448:8564-9445(+)